MTNRKRENVLVTGGGGFLGGAIVEMLHKRGDAVSSISRNTHDRLKRLGVRQIQGDIGVKQTIHEACRNMDVVFHVAAKPGIWGKYRDYHRTNVVGTQNVINACMKNKVSRLIYTSSPSVVFDHSDMEGVDERVPYPGKYHAHYPKTKAMAEQEVVNASARGLASIILRPHLIWGPGDNHLVPRIIARAEQLKKIGSGKNLVDTIYIDNAADAHILASDRLRETPHLSGRIYFISQDEPVPLWGMVDSILRAAGKGPVEKSMSRHLAWLAGGVLEMVYALAGIEKEPRMTRFVARELSTSHWFDISAAKNDLNYVPKVSIQEGLKRLENWLAESSESSESSLPQE